MSRRRKGSANSATPARERKGTVRFDARAKAIYLAYLAEHGIKQGAADAAGVERTTPELHCEKDPEFRALRDAALERYRDKLEREIHRRGVEGWLEPVYQRGGRVMEPVLGESGEPLQDEHGNYLMRPASIRKFSDNLLLARAKAAIPAYRDKAAVEVTASGGVLVVGSETPSEEDWAARHGGKD